MSEERVKSIDSLLLQKRHIGEPGDNKYPYESYASNYKDIFTIYNDRTEALGRTLIEKCDEDRKEIDDKKALKARLRKEADNIKNQIDDLKERLSSRESSIQMALTKALQDKRDAMRREYESMSFVHTQEEFDVIRRKIEELEYLISNPQVEPTYEDILNDLKAQYKVIVDREEKVMRSMLLCRELRPDFDPLTKVSKSYNSDYNRALDMMQVEPERFKKCIKQFGTTDENIDYDASVIERNDVSRLKTVGASLICPPLAYLTWNSKARTYGDALTFLKNDPEMKSSPGFVFSIIGYVILLIVALNLSPLIVGGGAALLCVAANSMVSKQVEGFKRAEKAMIFRYLFLQTKKPNLEKVAKEQYEQVCMDYKNKMLNELAEQKNTLTRFMEEEESVKQQQIASVDLITLTPEEEETVRRNADADYVMLPKKLEINKKRLQDILKEADEIVLPDFDKDGTRSKKIFGTLKEMLSSVYHFFSPDNFTYEDNPYADKDWISLIGMNPFVIYSLLYQAMYKDSFSDRLGFELVLTEFAKCGRDKESAEYKRTETMCMLPPRSIPINIYNSGITTSTKYLHQEDLDQTLTVMDFALHFLEDFTLNTVPNSTFKLDKPKECYTDLSALDLCPCEPRTTIIYYTYNSKLNADDIRQSIINKCNHFIATRIIKPILSLYNQTNFRFNVITPNANGFYNIVPDQSNAIATDKNKIIIDAYDAVSKTNQDGFTIDKNYERLVALTNERVRGEVLSYSSYTEALLDGAVKKPLYEYLILFNTDDKFDCNGNLEKILESTGGKDSAISTNRDVNALNKSGIIPFIFINANMLVDNKYKETAIKFEKYTNDKNIFVLDLKDPTSDMNDFEFMLRVAE